MVRKAHHKIEPHRTMELRVLIDNPQPFFGYTPHPCANMTQELLVDVAVKRSLLDIILCRPARTKQVLLTRPSTKVTVGVATIYCHPDHVDAIQSALTINLIEMISAANARHKNLSMEAACQ